MYAIITTGILIPMNSRKCGVILTSVLIAENDDVLLSKTVAVSTELTLAIFERQLLEAKYDVFVNLHNFTRATVPQSSRDHRRLNCC